MARTSVAVVGAAAALILGACSSSHPRAVTTTTASTAPPSTSPTSAPTPGAASGTGPVPGGFQPASVSFVSPTLGYLLGDSPGCSAAQCTSVVRTRDGGATWQAAASPAAPFAPQVSVASNAGDTVGSVRFADAADGWVFGPALWSTHDGSRTWHPVALGGRVLTLAAGGGSVYALVTPCSAAGASCAQAPVQLYRSPAGADQWQPVPNVSGLGLSPAALATAGTTAWAVVGSQSGGPPAVFVSTAGQAWHAAPDPCAPPTSLAAIAGADPATVFELCVGNPGAGSSEKALYRVTQAGMAPQLAGRPPTGGQPDVLGAADATHVVVGASSGADYLYRSADGGASWSTAFQSAGGAGLSDLAFVSSTQAAVVRGRPGPVGEGPVPAALLMSHDGGTTWAAVPIG